MTEHATLPAEEQAAPRRLGRGLNALLGASGGTSALMEAEGHEATESNEIHVELIERNPFQPRQDFDPTGLQELTDSIKQHGLLQPLLVRPHEDRYQLIAGERRLLAAKKAGIETVPCRVMHLPDQNVFEVAIEENLKRKDLNVLEKAQAFQDYIKRFKSSKEDLAKKLSLDRSTVSNMLRLLELCEPVKKALREDKISAGHARALLPLPEKEQQDLCKQIQKDSLSVRKTEAMVKELNGGAAPESETLPFPGSEGEAPGEPKLAPEVSNHILSLQQQLQDHLGVKVEIKAKDQSSGKIIIHFESTEDFERIIREVKHAA